MEGFELYGKKTAGKKGEDKITITENLQVYFASGFCQKNELITTKSVLVHFNNSTRQVGFEFCDDMHPHGYKFTRIKKSSRGGFIAARKFLSDHGVSAGRANYEYEQKIINEGNSARKLFIITLPPAEYKWTPLPKRHKEDK